MSTTFRTAVVRTPGGPDSIEIIDVPVVGPGPGQVGEGGLFIGVQPGAVPVEERGVTVRVVETHPDGARLAQLLDATASGHLPARVHAVVPLDQVASAHRAVAQGGVRGRYVLQS
jgi:NADPH:quinone reductase-like Zn-dependent oxidoreductase